MKASAGSGKTYSLSREYIRVLLKGNKEELNYHRHILAVTFTNKATENMKSEIVESLDTIATNPDDCKYADDLVRQCGFEDKAALSAAARRALNDILNDYSAFSVSTIDKFFQRTLKAFAREIGQASEYKVELDKDSLVGETVDRVLDNLSEEDSALLKWLSDSSIERMENGEGYHLESALGNFAKSYLSPDYDKMQIKHSVNEKLAFSEENLRKLSRLCFSIRRDFNTEMAASAKAALKLFLSFGVSGRSEDAFRKNLSALASCPFVKPERPTTTAWDNACIDFKKVLKTDNKPLVTDDQAQRMTGMVKAIDDLFGERYRVYLTAGLLSNQVYVFRTAEALRAQYDAILKEKGVLGIDDTNKILKDIIGGTDTPFIYEKTGTRYKHFLLDEFQDTSVVQWDCIRPLLQNSISEACYNLIVGDVKQSIYRWRDADWHILGEKVEQDLQRPVVNPLEVNWRSSENVIEFNNRFYTYLSGVLGQSTLYQGVTQDFSGKVKVPGCVDVTFCDMGNVNAYVLNAVNKALERNFSLKDIAVIVRTNKQGGRIADYLSSNGIGVITDDSLRVDSSTCVRDVVAGLCMIDDPGNSIYAQIAPVYPPEVLENTRSIYEMADALVRQLDPERVNRETLHILAFMDVIKEYTANNGNSLHAFLQYWMEKGFDKKISCPKDTDAVTIITIHKSKGLDYPYVILPIRADEPIMDSRSSSWEIPKSEGTPFASCERALYHVKLTEESLFQEGYNAEKVMSEVDYINTWYVATTRAVEELCIISPAPQGKCPLSQYLEQFVISASSGFSTAEPYTDVPGSKINKYIKRYIFGTPSPKASGKEEKQSAGKLDIQYNANDGGGVRGSVRISTDAAEYFLGEGDGSKRKRGIMLHGIMQNVMHPQDLHGAVASAVAEGLLAPEDSDGVEAMLAGAMESVQDRDWFPEEGGRVHSERDIIRAGASPQRPDRVIFKDGSVEIIDYKFGEENRKYSDQVKGYMKDYADMGYPNVRGFLWYVDSGKVVEV